MFIYLFQKFTVLNRLLLIIIPTLGHLKEEVGPVCSSVLTVMARSLP